MCNSCCVITHVKCIHDTLKNNAYNVRKILWGSSNKLCINMHSHGQYEMANAWALAEGERERRRGEWVRWEEGGRVLYSVEPLFREPPQDQGKWSLNRSEVSPKWWLSWAYLIININQKI